MGNDKQASGQSAPKPDKGSTWKVILAWVGGASAILGLVGSLTGWFHTFSNQHAQTAQERAQMAIAETQAKQGEYRASIKTYGGVLKGDPLFKQAQDEQLHTAMLWVENFHVLGRDGANAADGAAPQLDEVMPVLDAGLARATASKAADAHEKAADVQAHLGWAHWLNWHIAERETEQAAEENLRAALATDANNVYANAMLGNIMLQNHENFQEAMKHLQTAAATGKERPLVREMQVGGLVYDEVPGARAELVRAANNMRKNNEPLDAGQRNRIVSFCYSPSMAQDGTLTESLAAVPEDDSWKTYLWLDDVQNEDATDKTQTLNREFIHANLLEVAGKKPEALATYRTLQGELKNRHMTIESQVDESVKRLSKS